MRNVSCYWWFSIYLNLDVKMGKNVSTLHVCHLKLKVQRSINLFLPLLLYPSQSCLTTVRYIMSTCQHIITLFFIHVTDNIKKKPSQNSLYNDNIFPQWQIFTLNCALSLSSTFTWLGMCVGIAILLSIAGVCSFVKLQRYQPATELANKVRRAYFCALRIYSPKLLTGARVLWLS